MKFQIAMIIFLFLALATGSDDKYLFKNVLKFSRRDEHLKSDGVKFENGAYVVKKKLGDEIQDGKWFKNKSDAVDHSNALLNSFLEKMKRKREKSGKLNVGIDFDEQPSQRDLKTKLEYTKLGYGVVPRENAGHFGFKVQRNVYDVNGYHDTAFEPFQKTAFDARVLSDNLMLNNIILDHGYFPDFSIQSKEIRFNFKDRALLILENYGIDVNKPKILNTVKEYVPKNQRLAHKKKSERTPPGKRVKQKVHPQNLKSRRWKSEENSNKTKLNSKVKEQNEDDTSEEEYVPQSERVTHGKKQAECSENLNRQEKRKRSQSERKYLNSNDMPNMKKTVEKCLEGNRKNGPLEMQLIERDLANYGDVSDISDESFHQSRCSSLTSTESMKQLLRKLKSACSTDSDWCETGSDNESLLHKNSKFLKTKNSKTRESDSKIEMRSKTRQCLLPQNPPKNQNVVTKAMKRWASGDLRPYPYKRTNLPPQDDFEDSADDCESVIFLGENIVNKRIVKTEMDSENDSQKSCKK